jgi:type III pantothenate kinase
MLLADIGNTHFHIYNGETVEHLSYEDAIDKYADENLCYISVKHHLEEKIEKIKSWKNISKEMILEGEVAIFFLVSRQCLKAIELSLLYLIRI